jgi:uncharacterized membrane protein SpoIIM required for sporulation
MDYARFEELRRRGSAEFERRLGAARARPRQLSYEDLEDLAVRYRQVLHDHALASSRYPGTAVARRLARLALAGTHYLQRDVGEHLPGVGRFFLHDFPAAMRRLSPLIAAMVGLFLVSGLFGFSLATVEPAVGASFLTPGAVDDLKRGRLWTESVFSVVPGSVVSSAIATNNLSVAITAWAGGVLAGLGALYVVLVNGLMLGAVLATTARYSMAGPLFEFIAAHGPLELSLIVICAAAGLAVGRALVVATDRPRAELLREAARDALVVLAGCLPWILLLGFVEGYVSPSQEVGTAFKAALGLLLEALFLTVAFNPFTRDEGRPRREVTP